ncbi:MAG: ABC transporter substrate-binding protein, partial [Dehalococcoidia bacterium]
LRDAGRLARGLARDFAALDTATAQPDGTVSLATRTPDALFLPALASLFAFIQPAEMAEVLESAADPLLVDLVIGSGPFLLESLAQGAVFVPHPRGHRLAGVERLVMEQPHGSGEPARMRFLAREIDHFLARDRRDLQALAAEVPEIERDARFENTPTVSTFFVGPPPWNNLDLGRALSGALNRGDLISRLHGGQAAPSGPVPPAHAAFALSEQELAAYPGYATDADADATAARALWEAAGGPALGPVLFDIPSIYDPLYSASSVVVERLVEVLGPATATAEVHSYPVISERVLGREYGSGQVRTWFGWAPPMTAPDPTRELFDTFRSGQPGWAATGLEDSILDGLLDAAMADFDLESRSGRVRAASRRILELGGAGVLHWLLQTGTLFRQPYLDGPPPTAFSAAHLDSLARLEIGHPAYPQGR